MRVRNRRRRGVVLVATALYAAGVFAVVGLAIDLGRLFVAKSETQTYCDSAAVAAALALDGTADGIGRAKTAVTSSLNGWNFATETISSPAVSFATSAAGPWTESPDPASGYGFVRVSATVADPMYFLPLVTGQPVFHLVSAATAGQVPVTSLQRGLAPYSAVSTVSSGPRFGFVPGKSYTLQWPHYNDTNARCTPETPENCFSSPPCPGDPPATLQAVVKNWGSKLNGYWGTNSSSSLGDAILNSSQPAPVSIGDNFLPELSSGNKASQAAYLDQRASQDTDTFSASVDAYLASRSHNGRRLIQVAIVDPVDAEHTFVSGYGQFLLFANGSPSNYYQKNTQGNDPFCAVYVGPYNLGSAYPATAGSSGASVVRLFQ